MPLPAVLHCAADSTAWVAAAAGQVSTYLQQRLAEVDGRVGLLLSGGSTPAPVYQALSRAPLDWSRVDVGLVDERWLPVGDADSNARLIRETLLVNNAAAAHFTPLLVPGRDLAASVDAARAASAPGAVVVLGMGPDGHTASLFPGMRGFHAALASPDAYVAVDATGCPGAGPWPTRISLTPAGLARTAARVLLLRGEDKRRVLERALQAGDPDELPIRVALTLPGPPLQIHWCP